MRQHVERKLQEICEALALLKLTNEVSEELWPSDRDRQIDCFDHLQRLELLVDEADELLAPVKQYLSHGDDLVHHAEESHASYAEVAIEIARNVLTDLFEVKISKPGDVRPVGWSKCKGRLTRRLVHFEHRILQKLIAAEVRSLIPVTDPPCDSGLDSERLGEVAAPPETLPPLGDEVLVTIRQIATLAWMSPKSMSPYTAEWGGSCPLCWI